MFTQLYDHFPPINGVSQRVKSASKNYWNFFNICANYFYWYWLLLIFLRIGPITTMAV